MSTLYGFTQFQDTADALVTTVGIEAIYDAIAESAALYSKQVQDVTDMLVQPTTKWQEKVRIANSADLQPIDDNNQPKPIKFDGEYTQGYPLQAAGTAFATNRKSQLSMTIKEAERRTRELLKADAKWMKRHMLAALFMNAEFTFVDPEHGNITVKPLANGDSTVYTKFDGTTATADLQFAQANAISSGADDPFPTIKTALNAFSSNRGKQLLTYIADDLKEDVRGQADFVQVTDAAIIKGSSADQINAARVPDVGPGEEVIGKVDDHWIATWAEIPSGYMLTIVLGKEEPVLKQRNEPYPELQGFFPELNSGDGNLAQMNLLRYAGFGVYDRIGAAVTLIGNANYSAPSGMDAPLIA